MCDISKLNTAFYAEIGTVENPKGSNNIKYNTDYYGHDVSGDNYAWCCAFIWWVFKKCGMSNLFCNGNKTAYCPFVVNWARAHNQWVTSGYQQGDILLYDWDGDGRADHIGWCAGVGSGFAKSIEGNSSDAVKLNNQPFSKIMGAYRPKYTAKVSNATNQNNGSTSTNTENSEVVDGTYTVKPGDSLWAIGQKLNVNYLDLAKENGISSPYIIRPGQILYLPGNNKNKDESGKTETSEDKTYIVKSGDSLWKIAQTQLGNGAKWIEIKKANNLTSDVIHPGQKLIIP